MDGYDRDDRDTSGSTLTNVEAEAALLGALMIDNRLVEEVMMTLDADAFVEPVHADIYRALLAKSAAGEVASPVTLRPLFEADERIRELGGPGYLATLTGSGASLVGARDFAKQIAELARLRIVRDGLLRTLGSLNQLDVTMSVAGVVTQIEQITSSVASNEAQADRFTGAEAIDRVINNIVAIQDGSTPPGMTLDGLSDVVKLCGPFVPKHLQIWAGRPGMGKSGLACSAALAGARGGFGVGFISLEMGDIDLGQRFASDVSHYAGQGVKHALIRDARVDIHQLRQLSRSAAEIRDWNLQIVETAGVTMSRIAGHIRRMKRVCEAQGKTLHTVFVDYLQLILPDEASGNRTSDVTYVSNALKRLAKELNICIVALSQLSRQVESREDKRPQLSDLRESGAIEQDADLVMFLYREEYYLEQREPDPLKFELHAKWQTAMTAVRDHLELIVPKRRNGSTGKRSVLFFREFQAVRNLDFYELAGRENR